MVAPKPALASSNARTPPPVAWRATVAAGEFVTSNTWDEIATGHGGYLSCAMCPPLSCYQADATVKVFEPDETLITNGSFFAFPDPPAHSDFGVTLATGDVVNAIGPTDIIVGRGPGHRRRGLVAHRDRSEAATARRHRRSSVALRLRVVTAQQPGR